MNLDKVKEKYTEYCLCFQSEWTRGEAVEKAEDCMVFIPELIEEVERQQKLLESVIYVNEKGEPKMTTKEFILFLMDFRYLQDENEKLKNTQVEELERKIEKYEKSLKQIAELPDLERRIARKALES